MTTVISGAVEGLLQTGAALGLERKALLAVADLDEAALLDRDARLPLEVQIAIGRAIVEARPGVNVGLVMLRRIQPGALGALGYALASCETLGQALSTFVRYQRYLTEAFVFRQPSASTLTLDADPRLVALGHPVEVALGLWVAIGRRLAGADWRPRAISFRHAPLGDPVEHAALFGVAPRFSAAANTLELDPAILVMPLQGADLALRSPMLRLLEGRLASPAEADLVAAARAELQTRLPRGTADKSSVARVLGMSPRTLARRLSEAGTSYSALLERTRREVALELLEGGSLAVYEIAFLLGYSEPSTFHRAFRRWTGKSPDAWRRAGSGAV